MNATRSIFLALALSCAIASAQAQTLKLTDRAATETFTLRELMTCRYVRTCETSF